MRKTREILRLRWADGRSLREIGLACGVGGTTVHDVLARAKAARLAWPLPDDLDDAALEARLYPPPQASRDRPLPDFAVVFRELKRRGVTLELLWQEYRADHLDGYGYSRFCDLYREWRGQLDVVMRQEHHAGEKLLVDWAGMTMSIVDATTGEVTERPVFVAALGASSFTYAEVFESQALRCWIAGHIHAFEHVGGVAAVTVLDNPKTAVSGPDFYEPDLHATYAEMARHYGTAVIPARVRRPRDKAKVESAVQQVERWVLAPLRNQTFFSIAEANRAIRERLDWLNDRALSRLDGSRRLLWQELDRPALRPLPTRRFEIPEWKVNVGVNIDYHGHLRSPRVQRAPSAAAPPRGRARHGDDRRGLRERAARRLAPAQLQAWRVNDRSRPHARRVREVLESRPHPEQGFRSCLGIIASPTDTTPSASRRLAAAPERSGRRATEASSRS